MCGFIVCVIREILVMLHDNVINVFLNTHEHNDDV
jgi:hypothetical protein